jgi:hypothetical protein
MRLLLDEHLPMGLLRNSDRDDTLSNGFEPSLFVGATAGVL